MILEIPDSGTAASPSDPAFSYIDVVNFFIDKYGKSRGTDFWTRFLSIMQFIEHYQNDLVLSKLIEIKNGNKEVQNELLNTLLGSFRPPQSSSILPSSPLFNQEHEFNYRKVVKAVKLEAHD